MSPCPLTVAVGQGEAAALAGGGRGSLLHLTRGRVPRGERDELVLEGEPHEVLPSDDALHLIRAVHHDEVPQTQASVMFRHEVVTL